ncbi:MAG: hypothetical protein JRH20_05815 [Deltaproteobacteria bacterium]|nr:hypothetical protein [Deltaproteobacteria bacterium]
MRVRIGLIAGLLIAGFSPTAHAKGDPLLEGEAEKKLLVTLRAEKYIRAREQAEQLLRKRPRSILARFALSRVFHQEEGNLPRALYQGREAEKELFSRFGNPPQSAGAQSWHRRILLLQATILGEMDRRKEQLATFDRHDVLYQPHRDLLRVWPLMKLHRFKEATSIARKATLSSDISTRIAGFNGLLSIEFERERPVACFRLAMEAVHATAERSCILNLNTAEAAFAVFRFDEAERLALKSIQAPLEDCPASAHPHLANLYLLKGDFQRAMSAVKDGRKQGVRRRYRQQFEMGVMAWLTRLLYALGKFDKSYELSRYVIRRPDRVGMISYSKELMSTVYNIDYYAALAARAVHLREKAAGRTFTAALKLRAEATTLMARAWLTRRRVARLLAEQRSLPGLLRPYLKPLPSWQLPTLARIAGAGVAREALRQARVLEHKRKRSESYFAAIEGELAFVEGRAVEALRWGERALASLPKEEVLLRGRVSAWVGVVAAARGKTKRARRALHFALHHFPTALRLLDIALPVKIEAGKGALAQRLARRLRSSPRLDLRDRGLGFKVSVVQQGQRLQICLLGERGRRYACVAPELKKDLTQDEHLARLSDAFHETIFAPLVDLTQQDINSLDGSAVRGRADDLLKEVLGP